MTTTMTTTKTTTTTTTTKRTLYRLCLALVVGLGCSGGRWSHAFVPQTRVLFGGLEQRALQASSSSSVYSRSTMKKKKKKKNTVLHMAKKNKGPNNPAKLAALEALEALEDNDEVNNAPPLTKKELKAQVRAQKQASTTSSAQQQQQQQQQVVAPTDLTAKEAALQRALDLEEAEETSTVTADHHQNSKLADESPLSSKKIKAQQKKADKLAAKQAKKLAKKQPRAQHDSADHDTTMDMDEDGTAAPTTSVATVLEPPPPTNQQKLTLEEKIRKDRPPPRIRVMDNAQPGYAALRLERVGITFRDQQVLKDVTWGVTTGDRIGLVGANGAGKTTQLRILAGEMEPTTGDVLKSSKDIRVAMLRQEFVDELVRERTLKEEFTSVFEQENRLLQDIRNSEKELEEMGNSGDADKMQEILDRMEKLQQRADAKEVYALESRVKKIMDLMGFTDDEGEDLVASFSGGWKMRIGLGKVLLKDPNILLLDEPTNHLDLESVEWLEEFLRQQNIPMVIVSHDREFLDQVCTKIVDAEGGICNEYDGNYSRFLQLKKARMDAWHAAYNTQEKKIKEEKAWMNKFKVKQPQAVKQRQAKLEKLVKSDEYVQKPPFFGKPFHFRFPDAPRLSPEVAEISHLSHSYGNEETYNKLFEEVDLFVEKGDRIAVLGPNGSGKSTLLRFLVGKEAPDEGSARIVGANVDCNYFEQNQADALDLDKTVIETIQGASNGQSYNELRALLGQFLFKGDAVEKKVLNLSGGEKARLSLCCMMLRPANLLVLDEPTNHLDIPAKEMLEEALQHFQGSVMVVSHDRFFISKVATTIVAIEDKKLVKYVGDYKTYMEKSKHIKEKVEARYVSGVSRIESAPVIDLEALQQPKKKSFGGAKTAHMVTRKDKGVKNAKRMKQQ